MLCTWFLVVLHQINLTVMNISPRCSQLEYNHLPPVLKNREEASPSLQGEAPTSSECQGYPGSILGMTLYPTHQGSCTRAHRYG